MLNENRRRILKRAAKGAGALGIAAGLGAIGSPDFREFVGDDTIAAILIGAGVPALLAAQKALQRDRS